MVLEHALLKIHPGDSASFERDFQTAGAYIRSIEGYLGHSLHRDQDRPGTYLLLVRWRLRTDHEIGFRKSEAYQQWKALLHPYYHPMPTVAYFDQVI